MGLKSKRKDNCLVGLGGNEHREVASSTDGGCVEVIGR